MIRETGRVSERAIRTSCLDCHKRLSIKLSVGRFQMKPRTPKPSAAWSNWG